MASGNRAAVDDFFRRYLMPNATDASDNSSKNEELCVQIRARTSLPGNGARKTFAPFFQAALSRVIYDLSHTTMNFKVPFMSFSNISSP
jgi:hypothetical protein